MPKKEKPKRKLSKAASFLRDLATPQPAQLSVAELAELTDTTQQAAYGWVNGLWQPSEEKRRIIVAELKKRGIEFDDEWWSIADNGKANKRLRKAATL